MITLLAMSMAWGQQATGWVDELVEAHELDAAQEARVREIVAGSSMMGQGFPNITTHPMSRETCRQIRGDAGLADATPDFEDVCGRRWMAPLYDPETATAAEATQCIDQYEFPSTPCSYPVTWVRAGEAAQLCEALGKRLCDAHEWEGACQGQVLAPDYRYDLAADRSASDAVKAMRDAHNKANAAGKRWAYGDHYEKGTCAAASAKSPGCEASEASACGTNTYPTGAFPGCVSPLGVYDQHGNAAEHMNLPLNQDQLSSRADSPLGVTEMKGSWFIFDGFYAHQDWCRWRAPYWHGGPVRAADSHRNYHLGFRCCAEVKR